MRIGFVQEQKGLNDFYKLQDSDSVSSTVCDHIDFIRISALRRTRSLEISNASGVENYALKVQHLLMKFRNFYIQLRQR